MNDLKQTAIYVRVSSDLQAGEDHYSIPEQIDRLKKYCEANEWHICHQYVDAGFTGSNLNRPAMQELIADCNAHRIQRIVVFKLDRLSRSQRDTLFLIEEVFNANGISFVSLSEMFDTSTPFGIAMIGILSVFAQLERENIRDRMSMGRLGRAKKGLWRGGSNTPIGYDFIDGQLVINDYEAAQIRKIFEMFLHGNSYRAIAAYMHEHYQNEYSSYNDPHTISAILHNPLYIGKIKYRNQIFDGQHAPIIDQQTFDAAQAKIATFDAADNTRAANFTGRNLLSSMIVCAKCGARYYVHHLNQNGKKYLYYSCYSRTGNPTMRKVPHCTNKNYRVEALDQIVTDELRKLSSDPAYFAAQCTKSDEIDKHAAERKSLSKAVSDADKQISRLIDLYEMGIDVADLASRLQAAQKKKQSAQDQLNALDADAADAAADRAEIESARAAFESVFAGDDMTEKQKIVRTLIKRILIDGDLVIIEWNF